MNARERQRILAAVEGAMAQHYTRQHIGGVCATDYAIAVQRLCALALALGIPRETLAGLAGGMCSLLVPAYRHYLRRQRRD